MRSPMVLQLSSALRQFAQEENGGAGEADAHQRVSAAAASALLQRKQAKAARDAHNNGWPAFSAALTAARPAAREELRKFRMLVSRLIGSEVGACSFIIIHRHRHHSSPSSSSSSSSSSSPSSLPLLLPPLLFTSRVLIFYENMVGSATIQLTFLCTHRAGGLGDIGRRSRERACRGRARRRGRGQ